MRALVPTLVLVCACSGGQGAPLPDAGVADAGPADAGLPDGGVACTEVGAAAVVLASATSAGEHTLRLRARSASRTRWREPGNEALILEVRSATGLLAHLVLHQGAADFAYEAQLGSLQAGDAVSVRVSPLSAALATPRACVLSAELAPSTAEGVLNAPVIKWPVQKRFDDLPVVLGWSRSRKSYQLFYTNENGGTVALCGGGANGIQAEIARWGRAADVEGIFSYAGSKSWERCTGTVDFPTLTPRLEGAHAILYYGDGHNRLFESRGGYGQTCGTSSDKQADGDLAGWNVQNPGNDRGHDDAFTLTVRLVPVDLDALGYAVSGGRREAVQDQLTPWLYRLTADELAREGKIDGTHALALDRYLYVDVRAAGVDGTGDRLCSIPTSGGFVLRANLSDGGVQAGPQMTAPWFGGATAWKRLAIPLAAGVRAADVNGFTFDAYDSDGIWFLQLGDAFTVRAEGDNAAAIDPVRSGVKDVNAYVDDARAGCVAGVNDAGPGDAGYPCVGGSWTVAK